MSTIISIEGLNHRTAPVGIREKYALTRSDQESLLKRIAGFEGICEERRICRDV